MEVRSIADEFIAAWKEGIVLARLRGVSAGCVRALEAYAEADVADTVETIRETMLVKGPIQGAAVLRAWQAWYSTYVHAEIERLLPELSVRWPGERAKRTADRDRKALERWCSDGEDVVREVRAECYGPAVIRTKLGLSVERFDKIVAALMEVGAVRRNSYNRLIPTLEAGLVQRQLRARWLG